MSMNDGVLVPLTDRVRWTTTARIVVVALPLIVWALRPELRTTTLLPLLGLAVLVVGMSLATRPLLRLGRRATLNAVSLLLLLDGVYLAGAFLALGGFDGPIGFVLMLHAIAVTLLTSFRTGLKVVLWHSIALLVAIESQMTGLTHGPLTDAPFPSNEFATLLLLLWTATLGTATFAAANERELRRRRYDAEALRRLAMRLEEATELEEVVQALATMAHTELDARRCSVLVITDFTVEQQPQVLGAPPVPPMLVPTPDARPLIATAPDQAPPGWHSPGPATLGRALTLALQAHRPVLLTRFDESDDPYLASLQPGAQNVVVVPFSVERQAIGALVLEYGPPSRAERLLGRGTMTRRAVQTAEHAVAHAAQAFARAALVARLRSSADTDGLTGIANRRAFDRALEAELARTARTGLPTSVLLIDVDHFKAVNDTYGHLIGDDVLRSIGSMLDGTRRTGDVAARYGGEEFALILSGTPSDGARVVAERIRAAVREGTRPRTTVSIGFATTMGAIPDTTTVLQAADEALYRAKQAGRDRVVSAEQVTLSGVALSQDLRP